MIELRRGGGHSGAPGKFVVFGGGGFVYRLRIGFALAALLLAVVIGASAALGEVSGFDSSALFAEEEVEIVTETPGKGLKVYFFDLGRVDGILIRCDGVDSFIDAGMRSDATPAIKYLKGLGVTHLDSYICSHSHADHIEGGPPIIKTFGADKIYVPHGACYRQLVSFARGGEVNAIKRAQAIQVKAGETFQIGGATMYCLGPVTLSSCKPGSTAENENSLILKLVYGQRSILFTGDTSSGQLRRAAKKFPNMIQSDVLKNPHHHGTQDADVIKAISPKATIFCTDNEYPPTREYLSLLKKAGSYTYITGSKHDGNILIASDGTSMELTRGYPISSLTLNPVKALYPTQTVNVTGSIKPSQYASKAGWLNWKSSDPSVAKVSGGKITAVGGGTATITATSINGLSASIDVLVYSCGVILDKTSLDMNVGDSAMLRYKIGPTHPEDVTAEWKSTDESVAFVTPEGEVIAVTSGTVKVGVLLSNGAGAACTVTVHETLVKKVKLSNHSLKLSVGEQASLSAKLSPSDATNRNVQWASSDTSVVTVDAFGNVTAVGKGKAKIGARAASGVYDVCEVKVN